MNAWRIKCGNEFYCRILTYYSNNYKQSAGNLSGKIKLYIIPMKKLPGKKNYYMKTRFSLNVVWADLSWYSGLPGAVRVRGCVVHPQETLAGQRPPGPGLRRERRRDAPPQQRHHRMHPSREAVK